jgi:hypothetical protein
MKIFGILKYFEIFEILHILFKYMYLFKCPILGLLFGIIKQLLPSMDCKHQNCYPSQTTFKTSQKHFEAIVTLEQNILVVIFNH